MSTVDTQYLTRVEDEGSGARGDLLFACFSFLLSAGVLFHQGILESHRHVLSYHTLLSLAALWCLLRPSSTARFLTLAYALLVSGVLDLPRIMNHTVACILLASAVLLQAFILRRRSPTRSIDQGQLYACLASVVRPMFVLVYLFAALAKLNHDYLNPELSAGLSVYRDAARHLPLPTGPVEFIIWSGILIEALLALLLLIPKTRLLGILLAIPFHLFLAVAGHIPFSGFAFAFLFPFMPERFARFLQAQAAPGTARQRTLQGIASWASSAWAFALVALVWFSAGLERTYDRLPAETDWLAGQLFRVLYYLLAGFVLFLFLRFLGEGMGQTDVPPAPAWNAPVPWSIAALVLLNALCPYLGLKTQTSFTMYSNLRTEGKRWNHLFMPRSMRVFTFQNDLVRILDSTDPDLDEAAERGESWVYFEFARHVSAREDVAVTYERGGRIETLSKQAETSPRPQRANFLLRRLLWFRPVLPPERNTIQH